MRHITATAARDEYLAQRLAGFFKNEHTLIWVLFGATDRREKSRRTAADDQHALALFFGPNARHMPLIAHGSFRVVTINLAPGAAARIVALPDFFAMTRPLSVVLPDRPTASWGRNGSTGAAGSSLGASQLIDSTGAARTHCGP